MIEVQNISKIFNEDLFKKDFHALNDVSFKISEGDLVGFLGANGAGKTTLLKIILKFITPSCGNIIYDKKLSGESHSPFKYIGYMPERPYYYPNITGDEFLDLCGKLSGVNKEEFIKQKEYWTKRLKIDFALKRKVGTYSKGMLQRLGFCSALIQEPKLIILDEPLSGLDPVGRKEFKDILLDLNKRGVTVFFSSHIVSDVEELCNKVIVLEKGQLIFSGMISQIIDENSVMQVRIAANVDDALIDKYRNYLVSEINGSAIFLISHQLKSQIVKDIIDSKGELISLVNERASLEEIIYKLRKNA